MVVNVSAGMHCFSFAKMMGNMSVKCNPIIEMFHYFSLDMWLEEVESDVTLLTVHLSALEFGCVFIVKFNCWFSLVLIFNLIRLIASVYIRLKEIWWNFRNLLDLIFLNSFMCFPLLLKHFSWSNFHHTFEASTFSLLFRFNAFDLTLQGTFFQLKLFI